MKFRKKPVTVEARRLTHPWGSSVESGIVGPHGRWPVSVYDPPAEYVNVHPRCLHLWEVPS